MRIQICAIGRLQGRSEERALSNDYMSRLSKAGRVVGLTQITETEVEDRKSTGMSAEADLLRKSIPHGAILVCLDERGQQISSPDLAEKLADWRDQGRDVAFVIGGADGIDPTLRAEADFLLSFGPMVWPHKLVRVMLTEQLYRAATILAGAPYHRV